MKQPVSFLFLLPLVTLLAFACGDGAEEVPSEAQPGAFCGPAMARVDSFMATFADREWDEERYGGMAVVGSVADLRGLGPADAGQVASLQHQQYVSMMTLVEFDEELRPRPYLAESWEISEDRSELTFHLRDDVYWHDGKPTTAHDVAFTYRTVVNPESAFSNPGWFQAYGADEEAVEVVDSLTITFRFRPHADPLEVWRSVAILPEHLLGDVPAAELSEHPYSGVCPIGNGPFRFVSRTPGESWTFGANPAFPRGLGGRPYLDRYVYRYVSEHSTLLAELLTGGLDVFVQMLPNQAETVEEHPDLDLWAFDFPAFFFIAWNSRVRELSDVRVRRALTLGINRRQLIDGVQLGGATLLNGSLPPTHWAFDPSTEDSLAYDPGEARRLLDEAGWADRDGDGIREDAEGRPLEIGLVFNQNQEREQVAEILRVQLQEIGVRLLPQVLEFGTYLDVIFSPEREFDGALITLETGFRIDDRDLFHSDVVDGPLAFSGTMDSELDRYLDTLNFIPNRADALPVWRDYQFRLMELQPYTFLYSALRRDGVRKRLRGAEFDTRGDWATIRHWWMAPQDREGR
jgi:peptide/nickel transport system substrate-binding protein